MDATTHLALPGNEDLARGIAQACGWRKPAASKRAGFPDGESYVRLHGEPADRIVDVTARWPILIRSSCFWFLPLTRRANLARKRGESDRTVSGLHAPGQAIP